MRKLTKIVCTLGPTAGTPKQIEALARAGMDIARINMSHGAWEQHRKTVRMVKALNAKLAKSGKLPTCVGIMLDTKGAEVRTGVVEKPVTIRRGQRVIFSHKPIKSAKEQVILVNHKHFGKDAKDAESIILDNGKMIFTLLSVKKDGSVLAKAQQDGTIGSRRHVNLPGSNLSMPSLTPEDWVSIKGGAAEGIDFIALSFIREASEVEEVREFFRRKKKPIVLISKMETRQSVENMREIIDASDGIMVARGDLGAEVPFEMIPVIQDRMVDLARQAGKPVIIATQMLESMIENPMPTRAEVTDIAHAATTYTDTTMLSGETASGAYPMRSIDAMVRVLHETEKHLAEQRGMLGATIRTERDAQASAAVMQAISAGVSAIVVMTIKGQTAIDISRFRPHLPVIACTPDPATQRALQFPYGVFPILTPFKKDPEATIDPALRQAKKLGLVKKGESILLVTDAKAHRGAVSTIQVRIVT